MFVKASRFPTVTHQAGWHTTPLYRWRTEPHMWQVACPVSHICKNDTEIQILFSWPQSRVLSDTPHGPIFSETQPQNTSVQRWCGKKASSACVCVSFSCSWENLAEQSSRTFRGDRHSLCLHCPIWQPLATGSYWALEIVLVVLRSWIFSFILFSLNHLINLNNYIFMTSVLESVALGQSSWTFSGHQNHMEGWLKHRVLGTPRVSGSRGPGWAQLLLLVLVLSQPRHCCHQGPDTLFVAGTVLCIILASTYSMPVAPNTTPPSVVTTTSVSRQGQCPLGSKIHP